MYLKVTLLLIAVGVILAYPNPDPKATHNLDKPILSTNLGQIQGAILASRSGKQIFSFRGIRYAKAPVDELRFQPPVAAERWKGIYNATADGPLCPQPTSDPTSEDCLLLNVYTNKLSRSNDDAPKRPVIVYFHPGGWYSSGAASYLRGPQYLLEHDIILVTVNYRLGTLGFLSTGDKEAPGNYGMKDQVLALHWVKDHIAQFGGDPDLVTIAGSSTGAASVLLHLVSPMSQGLFHRAIAMSGSSLGQWPVNHTQIHLAKKQAQILGCPDDTSANIVKCLRDKPAEELGNSLTSFFEFGKDPAIIWSPVMEEDFGQEQFLTAHPIHLAHGGHFAKVPLILGVTTDEFAERAFAVIHNETLKEKMNTEFEEVAPISFLYEREGEHSKTISQGIKSFYLSDKPLDNSSLPALVQLYSDAAIGFGVNRAAKLFSENNNHSVYYYRFNFKGRYSHFYLPDSNNTIPYGVVHHDDSIYLFHMAKRFPLFKESDPEMQTVNKLTTIWTNFAKTGNPIPETSEDLDNVKWEPFNIKTQKYLDIGNKLVLNEKLNEKRYAEWEKLFPLAQYSKKKSAG